MIHRSTSTIFVDSSKEYQVGSCPPFGGVNFHAWQPGRSLDWHAHGFLQLILVLSGSLEVDWGAGWRAIATGQAHVLPPGARHRLRSLSGHRQWGLNFASGSADPRGLAAALTAAVPRPAVLSWPEGPALVAQVQAVLASATPRDRIDLALRLDRCCLSLLDRLSEGGDPAPADQLLGYLAERRHRAVSVVEAATALGVARSTLQGLCRVRHGCGVARLHERLRLERAAGLLAADPATGVAAVAEACGYPDVFAFSRAFRRVLGRPPAAWRREHAGG